MNQRNLWSAMDIYASTYEITSLRYDEAPDSYFD